MIPFRSDGEIDCDFPLANLLHPCKQINNMTIQLVPPLKWNPMHQYQVSQELPIYAIWAGSTVAVNGSITIMSNFC